MSSPAATADDVGVMSRLPVGMGGRGGNGGEGGGVSIGDEASRSTSKWFGIVVSVAARLLWFLPPAPDLLFP